MINQLLTSTAWNRDNSVIHQNVIWDVSSVLYIKDINLLRMLSLHTTSQRIPYKLRFAKDHLLTSEISVDYGLHKTVIILLQDSNICKDVGIIILQYANDFYLDIVNWLTSSVSSFFCIEL